MALPDKYSNETTKTGLDETSLTSSSSSSSLRKSLINAIEDIRSGKRMKGQTLNPTKFSNKALKKMLRDLEQAAEQRALENRPGGEPLLLAHGGRVTKRAMMPNKRKKTRKNKVYANGGGVRRAKYSI